MVYQGHIENGQVVLDHPADLPEGAVVFVELAIGTPASDLHPDLRRFTGILPSQINVRDEYAEAMRVKHG